MSSSNNVLIAVDAGSHSKTALKYYLKYIYRQDHKLVLFHVVEVGDHSSAKELFLSDKVLAEEFKEELEKAKKVENEYMDILREHKIHQSPRFRIEGSRRAGHVIVQAAGDEHAMLIVMGCRGRGGLARAILGSTSDYVMHHTTCPVLISRE